ncbi:MAG: DJ-1/PfpI family protein [Caldilineaceae bacterium]|nr:DJ-1/PfpI family protein [Caldilineaceae bacterium]
MNKPSSTRLSSIRRIQSALLLLAAFIVPTLVAGAIGLWSAYTALFKPAPQPYAGTALQPPAHDPTKRTVAVLASNQGTEISDFLAPFEVFATTGAFNVYAVAPERTFTPFMWGGLDIMPHYSFAELDQLLGKDPDVIVIPFFKDPENPEIVEWIRGHAGPDTLVVSICAGVDTLAATGLLDGGRVTTHQTYFGVMAEKYPNLELVRNVRYTDNGMTITSSGITGGIDASLHAIDRLLGKQAALDVAHKLNYPHVQFLDAPLFQVPARGMSEITKGLNGAFYWNRQEIGAFLFEGVGEIDLSAVLDTYGSTFTARATTFAAAREVIRSRNGLYLIPRQDFTTASDFDRILVPGDSSAPAQSLVNWLQNEERPAPEILYATDVVASGTRPFAYDITITDLARRSSEVDARTSLATLEYPAYHLQLGGRSWPLQRLGSALLVGLAGLSVAWTLQKRGRTNRRQPLAATVKPVAA